MFTLIRNKKAVVEVAVVTRHDEIDYYDGYMEVIRYPDVANAKNQLRLLRDHITKHQFVLDYISSSDMIEIALAVRKLTSNVYTGKTEHVYATKAKPAANQQRAKAKRVNAISDALDDIF